MGQITPSAVTKIASALLLVTDWMADYKVLTLHPGILPKCFGTGTNKTYVHPLRGYTVLPRTDKYDVLNHLCLFFFVAGKTIFVPFFPA